MKLSTIKDFLEEKITVEEFKENISSEVHDFVKGAKKRGSSIPIYLYGDCNLFIGSQHAILLLQFYVQNKLDENFIAYIVDALLLSENVEFESEAFLEIFETLTDPEVNGSLTSLRADELMKQLKLIS